MPAAPRSGCASLPVVGCRSGCALYSGLSSGVYTIGVVISLPLSWELDKCACSNYVRCRNNRVCSSSSYPAQAARPQSPRQMLRQMEEPE